MTTEQEHARLFALLDRYLDAELEASAAAEVAAHLARCAACRQYLAELQGVERAYAREQRQDEAAPEYRARLLRRLRTERPSPRYDLVTVAEIDALAAFHSEETPVVSLYLDVRPAERQGGKLRAKLVHLLDEASRRPFAQHPERRRAFQRQAERLQAWLETAYDHTGRGLALFAASDAGLWRCFRLPVPVRDRLVVADRPYLRPLLTLIDEFERYLVILVDKQTARLCLVYLGEIAEYTELLDELVPRPKEGGWSAEKYQRHHDLHVLWHVKHAAAVAERLWTRERCQWVLIGGPEEPLAELRGQLSKALAERVAGELAVSLKAGLDEILAQALAVEQATERRTEAERVAALLAAALGHGPGVLGLDPTLAAIVQERVQLLVVEEEFRQPGWECPRCHLLGTRAVARCPLCEAALDPQLDVVERAVERALDQRATLEVLRGEARQELAAHGHIGALLRYAG
jgi:peptide chain release factor subunit 1